MKPQWYYLIFWFFFFFFWNSLLPVGYERNGKTIFILSYSAFPNLFWHEMGAITVFFNLLNFFATFLEFSLTRQVGTKRDNNFYFLSLSLFQPILAWNHAIKVFFIFPNFFYYFFEFSIMHRVGTEQNDNFYFLSLVDLFHLILAWNEAITVFFNLLNFFAIFLEFYLMRHGGA